MRRENGSSSYSSASNGNVYMTYHDTIINLQEVNKAMEKIPMEYNDDGNPIKRTITLGYV